MTKEILQAITDQQGDAVVSLINDRLNQLAMTAIDNMVPTVTQNISTVLEPDLSENIEQEDLDNE